MKLETYEIMGKGLLTFMAFALSLQSAVILIHLPFNSTSFNKC